MATVYATDSAAIAEVAAMHFDAAEASTLSGQSKAQENSREVAGEDDQFHRIENEKKGIRNNWFNYISVERSSYTYREIGGIYDLYITVTNNSDYILDQVETQISYIKSNGEIYKRETVIFNQIPPHHTQKLAAPESNRGTSVDNLEITSIRSEDLNFCYSPGSWANNSIDPYTCR